VLPDNDKDVRSQSQLSYQSEMAPSVSQLRAAAQRLGMPLKSEDEDAYLAVVNLIDNAAKEVMSIPGQFNR
jgi:hypothetical protein